MVARNSPALPGLDGRRIPALAEARQNYQESLCQTGLGTTSEGASGERREYGQRGQIRRPDSSNFGKTALLG
jgi:hypothetical protein